MTDDRYTNLEDMLREMTLSLGIIANRLEEALGPSPKMDVEVGLSPKMDIELKDTASKSVGKSSKRESKTKSKRSKPYERKGKRNHIK